MSKGQLFEKTPFEPSASGRSQVNVQVHGEPTGSPLAGFLKRLFPTGDFLEKIAVGKENGPSYYTKRSNTPADKKPSTPSAAVKPRDSSPRGRPTPSKSAMPGQQSGRQASPRRPALGGLSQCAQSAKREEEERQADADAKEAERGQRTAVIDARQQRIKERAAAAAAGSEVATGPAIDQERLAKDRERQAAVKAAEKKREEQAAKATAARAAAVAVADAKRAEQKEAAERKQSLILSKVTATDTALPPLAQSCHQPLMAPDPCSEHDSSARPKTRRGQTRRNASERAACSSKSWRRISRSAWRSWPRPRPRPIRPTAGGATVRAASACDPCKAHTTSRATTQMVASICAAWRASKRI